MGCNKAKDLTGKRSLSCRCTDVNIVVSWKKIIHKNKHFGVLNIGLKQYNFKAKTKIFHFYKRISDRWALLLPAGNTCQTLTIETLEQCVKYVQS